MCLQTALGFSDLFVELLNVLKLYLWMNYVNPNSTSFMNDYWWFETPLAFKPIFVNMEIDFNNFQILDAVINDIDETG